MVEDLDVRAEAEERDEQALRLDASLEEVTAEWQVPVDESGASRADDAELDARSFAGDTSRQARYDSESSFVIDDSAYAVDDAVPEVDDYHSEATARASSTTPITSLSALTAFEFDRIDAAEDETIAAQGETPIIQAATLADDSVTLAAEAATLADEGETLSAEDETIVAEVETLAAEAETQNRPGRDAYRPRRDAHRRTRRSRPDRGARRAAGVTRRGALRIRVAS